MAKQRYVNTKIWRDAYVENLDPSEKLLFLYLLTNPDTNISGIYEIPLKIISVDIGFDKEMTKSILDRFEKDGKAKYSKGWVAIKNFMAHQTISPKIKIGIETELKNAPIDMVRWVNVDKNIDYTYPIKEVSHLNSNLNTNTNLNSNKNTKSVDDKSSPLEAKSSHKLIIEKHYVLYEAKFKRKYSFGGADGSAVKNILTMNYTLEEIFKCLDKYFDGDNNFFYQQGYTLKYFQSAISGLILGKAEEVNLAKQVADELMKEMG